ncbi:AIPR family protein, partial [Mycobacterium hubeiense]|uniref:AIPR family protein n=1 Tax=Mycobacterium hubeiense TaxID=1867256 RepID=UPI001E4293DE
RNGASFRLTGSAARAVELPVLERIADVTVTSHLWDLQRLYRLDTSGLEREVITVDIVDLLGRPLPCLPGPAGADHTVHLAVVPGGLVADLYGRYGSRLLERNVRSFLQARGAVNRGIRDTLIKRPDRFLAYNNGLSATAADVELVDLVEGGSGIARIRDLQIVNGGQTTASIHHAAARDKIDLSGVAVQLKLTVVRPDLIDEIVPAISMYSNTQNKVTGADFSANHPFHVRVEELSRTVWAPAPDGAQRQTRWFYERARGQYADEVARAGTPAKQRQFKATTPTTQKFTKTDLAKFIHSWEQRPNTVSLGAEKNFREFMLRLRERPITPDVEWFHRLIGMAILFRSAEKIVQKQGFGGYRAQIVTYTIAKLAHETESRLDLDRIWRQQRLSPAVEHVIAELSHPIHGIITNPSGTVRHVGEWAKKLDCWKAVEELPWSRPVSLSEDMRATDAGPRRSAPTNAGLAGATPQEQALIEEMSEIAPESWFGIAKWAKDTSNLQGWQRGIAFSIGRLLADGRRPSVKQAKQGKVLYEEALRLGFRPVVE